MKLSVNLLQEAQKIRFKARRIGLILQTASVVALVVFGIFVFLLFSYTLVLGRKQNNISKSIAEQKNVIQSLRSVEAKQVLVEQKVELAGKVINDPSLPYEVVTQVFELLSRNAQISSIEAVKGEAEIEIGAQASDVFTLVGVLDELVDFAKEHEVTIMVGESFLRNVEGNYRFQIILSLRE